MARKTFVIILFQVILCASPTTLLLDWWPNPNHVPLYYGIKKGIFLEEGIELSLIKNSEAPHAVSFVSMKNVDAALFYMPQAVRAAEKSPVRILCSLIVEPLQGLIKRKGRERLNTIGGYPGTFYSKIAEKCDARCKKIQIDSGLTLALYFNQVDAIFGAYPTIEGNQLKASGIETEFVSTTSLGIPTFSELVVIVHKDCNKELAACMQRAFKRSVEAAQKNPDKAFDVYLKANPDKTPFTIGWEKRAWEDTVPLLGTSVDMVQFSTFHDWMRRERLISEISAPEDALFFAHGSSKAGPQVQGLP